MCGITLIFNTDFKPVSSALINRMNHAIAHRGPDDNGVFIGKGIGLGHVRLSIVDIDGGIQPMQSVDNRHTIIFNGEIYNYQQLRESLQKDGVQFQTQSDTEVVLALFRIKGKDCLPLLRGMFSFIIYDSVAKTVFIARDRLGIKPLFYHWDGNTLLAGSEIKALFASTLVEPKINKESIKSHFKYQFSISPNTMFEQVYELPPGHFAEATSNGRFNVKEYWDLEFPEDNEYETDDINYWENQFEEALHDAAISHLIGEVPIGTYLSGGLNSSTMAFLLKTHYPKAVESFSIHFDNPQSDESYAYKPVANHFGIHNSELTMGDNRAGGYFDILKDCLYSLEQPQRMTVDIPHFLLSDHVHQHNFKVVYTGDGADEILAGYDCYRQDAIRVNGNLQGSEKHRESFYYSEYGNYFSKPFLDMLLQNHQPESQKRVFDQFGCYPSWYDFWQLLDDMTDDLFVDATLKDESPQMESLLSNLKPRIINRHPLNQSLYLDTKMRLPGWILWKSDRLSMAHSVETRAPFMDHPLVELSARLPPHLKLNGMDEKFLLKSIMTPHLPKIPGQYKKRAFYTPIRDWLFSEEHIDELEKYLSVQKLEESGLFNPNTVRSLMNELIYSPPPNDMVSYFRDMQREWVLMLVLSTQMLFQLFTTKEAPCFHDIN
ncbi:MAG: asparagine synthase (glutamine-hydrolyzing) [Gammaproteobacteria bacterium]|nr:asparagine synthase (glutamine-hydrolyzing) [Gammaproteobacteria bacterium]